MKPLPPFDASSRLVHAIIEAPRASRNKFKHEPESDAFVLDRVVPAGLAFPIDFGFVPGTLADDGDPIDIMVFSDEPLVVGCVVPTRLIGVIEARQTERGKTVRNDRLVGVSKPSLAFRRWRTLHQAGDKTIDALEQFFIAYNTLRARTFKPVARGGPARAHRLLQQAIRRASPQ